ncbi:Rpel repeat protein [Mycena indigotica]|uniref:Rpel repeat protein n=1 Tax=Mycena indigotica TaxID=2126181 RepID=A0A8H6TB72_9AGAR|nr:Rpel repeat protein [Mycena indigotica]KAF7315298.1 Rpel repeat protein [Mycena indigotica]
MSSSTRPSHPRQASIDQQASQLEEKLAHRPDKATLVDRNILKDDKGLAPALVAAKEKLQRSQLEDQLEKAIASRPTREQLEKDGILPTEEPEAAPAAPSA